MEHSLWVDGPGCRDVTLRQHLPAENSSMRHPLRWANKDILFSSRPAGIFDI
jgi:hypothetical protein